MVEHSFSCFDDGSEMEDNGRLRGGMYFAGDGIYKGVGEVRADLSGKSARQRARAEEEAGIEKSFISLFIMTPVSGTTTRKPKRVLMVIVKMIAIPLTSSTAFF
jgi:hypothetical protein